MLVRQLYYLLDDVFVCFVSNFDIRVQCAQSAQAAWSKWWCCENGQPYLSVLCVCVCVSNRTACVRPMCACDFHWQQLVVIALDCRLVIVSPARLSSMRSICVLLLPFFFLLILQFSLEFLFYSLVTISYVSHLLFPVHVRHCLVLRCWRNPFHLGETS